MHKKTSSTAVIRKELHKNDYDPEKVPFRGVDLNKIFINTEICCQSRIVSPFFVSKTEHTDEGKISEVVEQVLSDEFVIGYSNKEKNINLHLTDGAKIDLDIIFQFSTSGELKLKLDIDNLWTINAGDSCNYIKIVHQYKKHSFYLFSNGKVGENNDGNFRLFNTEGDINYFSTESGWHKESFTGRCGTSLSGFDSVFRSKCAKTDTKLEESGNGILKCTEKSGRLIVKHSKIVVLEKIDKKIMFHISQLPMIEYSSAKKQWKIKSDQLNYNLSFSNSFLTVKRGKKKILFSNHTFCDAYHQKGQINFNWLSKQFSLMDNENVKVEINQQFWNEDWSQKAKNDDATFFNILQSKNTGLFYELSQNKPIEIYRGIQNQNSISPDICCEICKFKSIAFLCKSFDQLALKNNLKIKIKDEKIGDENILRSEGISVSKFEAAKELKNSKNKKGEAAKSKKCSELQLEEAKFKEKESMLKLISSLRKKKVNIVQDLKSKFQKSIKEKQQ